MESSHTVATADTVPSGGLAVAGLWQVFSSPTAFFERLRHAPKVIVPWIATFIVMAAGFWIVAPFIAGETIEFIKSIPNMPAGRIPTLDQQIWETRRGVVFYTALVPLILAGVALLVGNFFLGGRAKFKAMLSVALYGEFLFAVGFLLEAALTVVKGDAAFSLSPAFLVADQGIMSVTYTALSKLSVFHIWETVVIGIGAGKIYQFSGNKGYIVAVVSMAVVVLLHIASSAATSMLVG